MPKLWFLGHPFNGRRSLRLQFRDWEEESWRKGYARIEWGEAERAGAAALPSMGDGNIDPLAVGPRMYYDYCKRDPSTNAFVTGDTILFGSFNGKLGGLIVDTVFVIGDSRDWPPSKGCIPDWPDLDAVALRVHFDERSHQVEHDEVHESAAAAHKSYRSRSASEDAAIFSWIPYMEIIEARPFVVREGSEPHQFLTCVYGDDLKEHVQGRFAIETISDADALSFHSGLRAEAVDQAFMVAVETKLMSKEEIELKSQRRSCAP